MAFGSSLAVGMWLRLQAAKEKTGVDGEQVPNGSRTKSVLVAGLPDTGSTTSAVTARVVAGSRTVPSGICRPRASVRIVHGGPGVGCKHPIPACPGIMSERLE